MSYSSALALRHESFAPRRSLARVRYESVGAWFASPGFLRDQVNKLASEYSTVGKELADIYGERCLGVNNPNAGSPECRSLNSFRESVWQPLAKDFYSFASDHQSWYQNFWGSTWDTIQEYRQKLIAFRENAEKIGFVFKSPRPADPPEGPWEFAGKTLRWGVYLVVALGIVYIVRMVMNLWR